MRLFQSMTLFLPSQRTLEQAESCYLIGTGFDFEFQDFCTSCYKKVISISIRALKLSNIRTTKAKMAVFDPLRNLVYKCDLFL